MNVAAHPAYYLAATALSKGVLMHILIATDGTLDPAKTAEAVARWHTDGDEVTVFNAVSIPTDFLRRLSDSGVEAASTIALEAGSGTSAGDRAAQQLAPSHRTSVSDPQEVSPVASAIASSAEKLTKPIVDALRAVGVPASGAWRSTEGALDKAILQEIIILDAELLVIGTHGRGRFEGLLGSMGTKLVRRSPISVLLIRNDKKS